MTNITLEIPNVKYKDSFIRALREFKSNDNKATIEKEFSAIDIQKCEDDFENYVVKSRIDAMNGRNLPEGYVPWTDYWMVDKDGFAGRITFRHYLNDFLKQWAGHIGYMVIPSKRRNGYATQAMALLLSKLKEQNIPEVMISCADTNIASKKTIEKAIAVNGGRFTGVVRNERDNENVLCYWINTAPQINELTP